ncbi:MAG: glycosyltransferase family A protein, partial [Bacteriovorax sp.]|nr:glycosyltransferase family A protein [Bacteriovorax sp.]
NMKAINKRNRIKDLNRPPMIPMDICLGEGIIDFVSVVIPTYNRDYILGQALESVLMQDYPHFEVIIVDDGSTDTTTALIEKYLVLYPDKIKYIKKENGGLVSARNEGMRHTKGEFIAFQDSDDIWLQGKISNQVALFKKHPEVVIAWTLFNIVDENGKVTHENDINTAYNVYNIIDLDKCMPRAGQLEYANEKINYRKGDIFKTLFLGNLIHPPVAVVRRSAIQKVGGLDQTYLYAGEDYEFFWRVARLGEGALIEKAGMLYRMGSGDQMTSPDLLLFVALGYEKIITSRLKSYPGVFETIGEGIVQKQLIGAYSWVISSEFTSTYGLKSNGRKTFLKLLRFSFKDALKLVPFILFYNLPFSLRSFIKSKKS